MIADRVWETNSATGTGAFVLTGAKSGYRTFAAGLGSAGQIATYCAVNGTEWEVGEGVFNGTNGLTRVRILSSSNSGSIVTFSAAPEVFSTASAEMIENANLGRGIAQCRGYAMP